MPICRVSGGLRASALHMTQRSYRYRLYPSKAQSVVLTEMLGAFCDLYNAALQQRIEAYRRQHKTLRYLDVDRLARSMLAKAVHNAAWSQLCRFLEYKAASAGTHVETVDPRGTSQTCPSCGTRIAKTLSERTHTCSCGCVMDRDIAAAVVVLQWAQGIGPGHGLRSSSQRTAA